MRGRLTVSLLLSAALAATVAPSAFASAASLPNTTTPQTIDLYLDWQMPESDMGALSKFDIVVLDADQQARYPDRIRELRELNPKIKILAYLPSEEIADARFSEPTNFPMQQLASQISDAWYLKSPSGARTSFWPGSSLLNVTNECPPGTDGERWNQFLPQFIQTNILSSGLWDGVFLDNTFDGITSYAKSAVDENNDGQADNAATANAQWDAGMRTMLTQLHALAPNALVIGNGGAVYASQLNGALFENFPSYTWLNNWNQVRSVSAASRAPDLTAINVNTNNNPQPQDYPLMRFGLASALTSNSLYSFDQGSDNHDTTWRYDEYAAPIGAPIGSARAASSGNQVWMRAYQHGLAIVNAGATTAHIALTGVFEKIRGIQDPKTNDGSLVSSVDVPAHDGLVLLSQAQVTNITNAAVAEGELYGVYDQNGVSKRNGILVSEPGVPNGAQVVIADVDRDGIDDTVTAVGGTVTVQTANKTYSFKPFGSAKNIQLSLAVGNTNRDKNLEIIVGRKSAGMPDVAIYSYTGTRLVSWLAYAPNFLGGITVAIGDLNGDGLNEIVTGAGPGGGPHIKIFKTDGTAWGGSFYGFDASYRGGVSVAMADFNGNGKDDIIVGSGVGSLPQVRIFDAHATMVKDISLGKTPVAGGISVAAADVDGDGRAELLVGGLPAF